MKLHEKWVADGEIISKISTEQHAKEMGMSAREYIIFDNHLGGLKGIAYGKLLKKRKRLDYIPTGKEAWESYKKEFDIEIP